RCRIWCCYAWLLPFYNCHFYCINEWAFFIQWCHIRSCISKKYNAIQTTIPSPDCFNSHWRISFFLTDRNTLYRKFLLFSIWKISYNGTRYFKGDHYMNRHTILFSLIFLTLILTACGNKAYEEAIENGMNALEEKNDEEAISFFETALEEKPEDETASQYIEETEVMIDGLTALEEGDLAEAKTFFKKITDSENSISTLQARSKDALHTIEELEADYVNIKDLINDAKDLHKEKEYKKALVKLDDILTQDFSHASLHPLEEDAEQLRTDIENTKEKTDKAAQKKKEEEKEQKQIDKILGYWLSEDQTMACHITESSVACAVKQSDVIFDDPVQSMEGNVEEDSVTITYENGTSKTHSTKTPDTLNFDTESFYRVSKEEANAIYDGYYELP